MYIYIYIYLYVYARTIIYMYILLSSSSSSSFLVELPLKEADAILHAFCFLSPSRLLLAQPRFLILRRVLQL